MRRHMLTLALAAAILGMPSMVRADEQPTDEFVPVKTMSAEKAKGLALAWLKDAKADAFALEKANAIWADKSDRPVLDRVAETLLLGSEEGRDLIAAARDPNMPAPVTVPKIFVDPKQSAFFKANLGLYFAKHMCNRRVFEEALATLKAFKADETVDPASYYFFQAVAANKLLFKDEGLQAIKAIEGLKDNSLDVPERYLVVSALMKLEMLQWKTGDLNDIARRMKEVEDRLENARHGSVTLKKEDEIVKLLDAMIKQLEKECEA